MTQATDLRGRLDELGKKISEAEDRLKLKKLLHKDHKATADDLSKRYQMLCHELDNEVAAMELQGEHVGSFEKTVLNWINHLNFDQ